MKKIIACLFIFCLLSCSGNDEENKTNYINIKLSFVSLQDYVNDYSFSDFKYAIYESKEDYFNEMNPITSGNFDTNGEVSISENLESKSYFVDIFSNDKVIGNWQLTDLDIDISNIIKFFPSPNADFFNTVSLEDNLKLIGTWDFFNYEQRSGTDEEPSTDKNTLIINKDFTVQSTETLGDISYTVYYDFRSTTPNYLNFISISPNEDNYPAPTRNNDGLTLQYDAEFKLLRFEHYDTDSVRYRKAD